MILKALIFSFISIISLVNGEFSPVLLWNSASPYKPTLEKISAVDFSNYIMPDVANSMLVVFIVDHLKPKDFSACKLNSSDVCYRRLSQMKDKVYYANVKNPVDVLRKSNLKKVYLNYENNDANNLLNENVDYEKGKIVFITLPSKQENSNENEAEFFSKLDSIINEVYEKLSAGGKTVGMYTENSNKVIRVARQTIEKQQQQQPHQHQQQQQQTKNGVAFNIENKFLIYFTEILYKNENDKDPKELKIQSGTLTNKSETGFNVELNGDNHQIKFRIDEKSGYWHLTNLYFDTTQLLRFENSIHAATQFSYYCGNQIVSDTKRKITLYLNHLQLQPNFSKTSTPNTEFNFDDPWHCVGFTSVGIWSGLFVTFMMLAILSVGITWLMDIRTMDRFDDPKGKTITVNASD